MTELEAFLTALYDSFSDAEMQALQHGQARLAQLLGAESVPADASVPVYHATDVEVTLQVGLQTEETEDGLEMYVEESPKEEASTLAFTIELFDLVDRQDLDDLDLDDLRPDAGEASSREVDSEERPESGSKQSGATDEAPPVTVVDGIGPAYAERLQAQGIETLADLVERSPEDVAAAVGGEQADLPVDRTRDWLDQARGLVAMLSEREGEQPVELVDGIGPTFGRRLRENGIEELSDLVAAAPEEIAEIVSTEEVTISPARIDDWLDQAERQLEALDTLEDSDDVADESTSDSTDDTGTAQ